MATEVQSTSPDRAETARVARAYFEAIGRGDRDAQRTWYANDAVGHVFGAIGPAPRAAMIAYFDELYAAFPDLRMEVLDVVAEDGAAAVRWRLTATFAGPGSFQGLEPTGRPIETEGVDLVRVRDGRVARVDAYTDHATVAQQLGVAPPTGSRAEQRLKGAVNARTRLGRHLTGGEVHEVAEGVWTLQGNPGRCNVFFLRDGDGVLLFDAGARTMLDAVRSAAARLGGLTRIVLGHAHTDHRGTAPGLGVPVLCHPDEVLDAEGTGGFRYWTPGLRGLPPALRVVHGVLHRRAWDGGPVSIAGTVSEGDDVAGFEVVHLPGHAPGLIALWRAVDRLALTSDAFYTLDMWGRDSAAHLPEDTYNLDTAQARASVLKLAALQPSAAWPGHARPLVGDVDRQLERAVAG